MQTAIDENPQQTRPGVDIDLAGLIDLRRMARGISLSSSRHVLQQQAGGFLSRFRGRGMDFEEVREYQPGDDLRSMDWRVTARRDKPHTKLYREERERPIFLVVDQRVSMRFGTRVAFKSVIAAQVAALIGWAAVDGGDRIGGIVFNDHHQLDCRPQARSQGALRLFHALLECQHLPATASQVSFAEVLRSVRRVMRPGSFIVPISDFAGWDEAAEIELKRLSQHNEVLSCMIYDELEASLPVGGTYTFTDGVQRVTLDAAPATREQYHQSFQDRLDALQSLHQHYGMSWLPLATDADVVQALRRRLL